LRVLIRKRLLRQADVVQVNGTSGLAYLLKLGVNREKIVVFPNCTDIGPQLALPLERKSEAARRLLYVGRLIERKGLLPFLAALKSWLLAHPGVDYEFWIVGDGPLRRQLEAFPVPPALRLRFLGGIEFARLAEIYAQCGIFAFPTLADEWGIVVNEALAAGLPVLGSRYSQAVTELVREDDPAAGWIFRPDDQHEMQNAIERALSTSTPMLARMRETCRRRVRHLTPAYFAEQILSAIRIAFG
jgi:hypothetical protein